MVRKKPNLKQMKKNSGSHHSWSMYVWRTFTPFPFIPLLIMSKLDMLTVPTATGALGTNKDFLSLRRKSPSPCLTVEFCSPAQIASNLIRYFYLQKLLFW